ncbi:MAG: TonB-dependent receptor [Bacteroides sp.]|nr:TonB-dependent receptor [Bacteroides sp.]
MRNYIISLFLLLVAGIPMSIHAQNSQSSYSVKGILVDSLTNEGEPYATIRIALTENLQKPIRLAVTTDNGKFNEKLKQPGNYVISFSSVGKNTVQRNFTLTENAPNADLGTILISESSEMLKGVEVVAQKPLVKAEIDKVTYSIEDDPDAQTNSTLEMLRKVPLVTVDGEDKIQVNGSSNFKVHVNGKPNSMMSNNPKEVLKSLPANSVKYIEVITDPGAKYDAEGIGGILNIITITGSSMQGYTVSLNAGANNRGYNVGAYGTVQVGKFTVTGNYSYNHSNTPASTSCINREDFTSETYKYLSQKNSGKSKGDFNFGSMEGSYEIDSLNLITFSMQMYGGSYDNRNTGQTQMQNSLKEHVYSYNTFMRNSNMWSSIGANIDYQHSFKKKGEYLTFSYRYNGSPDNSEANTEYEDIRDYPYDLHNQRYNNDARTDEHTFQLDYTNPISNMHDIDFGAKYILRNNKSESKYFKKYNGNYQVDENLTDNFKQTQDILAAYGDYKLKWKKIAAKVGVRYEHTFMNVEYEKIPDKNFNAGFDDIVPSMILSYQLGPAKTLRANYNMRISRPGIWYLNPFKNTSNPTNISYGNPDLETEKSHSLSLGFSSFSAKFNVNANLGYSFVNNGIQNYSFMNNGVMESTYGNIGHTQRTTLSLWMNWNPGNKTRISINASGVYTDLECNENFLKQSNNGFFGNLFLNAQQTLPWNLRFSLYGGGTTPYIHLQGKGSSYMYYGFSLSRSFLKEKRLSVSINTSNLFHKYMTFKNETMSNTFHSWYESKDQQQSFGLNISWRFGELKAQVKKANRTINNDDLMSGGSGQGSNTGSGN